MEEKIFKIVQTILSQQTEMKEDLGKLKSELSSLTHSSKHVDSAFEIMKQKKVLTKDQLLSEIGISPNYYKGWKDIINDLEKQDKVDVHAGLGRSKTLLVLKNEDSYISLASKLFKKLEKKRDYNVGYVAQILNIDPTKALKVVEEMVKMFDNRIKAGMGGIFKRIY